MDWPSFALGILATVAVSCVVVLFLMRTAKATYDEHYDIFPCDIPPHLVDDDGESKLRP